MPQKARGVENATLDSAHRYFSCDYTPRQNDTAPYDFPVIICEREGKFFELLQMK